MSMHRGPLPDPKPNQSIDWKNAAIWAGIWISVFVFIGGIVWATGLWAYLTRVVDKNVLGIVLAVGVVVITIISAAMSNRRR